MDKLVLTVKPENFIKNQNYDNNFLCKPAVYSLKDGSVIGENKYYCNTEFVNYDISEIGLKVSFNPNKVAKVKQLEPVNYNQFQNSIDYVSEVSKKVGLNYDVSSAKIYRYDNNYDFQTEKEYHNYISIFSNLHCSIKNARKKNEVNTYYFNNKSNEIAVYDKSKHNEINKIDTISNIIRFETRRLKISNSNKMMLSDITKDKFDIIRISDKNYILNNLFNKNINVLETEIQSIIKQNFSNDVETISYISGLTVVEIAMLLFNNDTEKVIGLFKINNARTNNKQYQRNIKFVKKYIKDIGYLKNETIELYFELKEKLSKVA